MLKLDTDYVNSSGNIIKKEELIYIDKGVNSSVWKYIENIETCDMAFKAFFDHAYKNCLNFNTYERMKYLPLKNIIKATDIYYKLDKYFKDKEKFDAYLMPYLDENKDILLSEIFLESLLKNISSLENDIKIITDYNILMYDVKPQNSIICSSDLQLYITDIDMFLCNDEMKHSAIDLYFSSYRTKKLNNLRENRCMLLSLIKNHFLCDVDKFILDEKKKSMIKCFLRCYFSSDSLGDESITNHVERLFQGYDSAKQYFIKK